MFSSWHEYCQNSDLTSVPQESCRASLAYFERRFPQAENAFRSPNLKRNKYTKITYATKVLHNDGICILKTMV